MKKTEASPSRRSFGREIIKRLAAALTFAPAFPELRMFTDYCCQPPPRAR
jgi:hypothetical protein